MLTIKMGDGAALNVADDNVAQTPKDVLKQINDGVPVLIVEPDRKQVGTKPPRNKYDYSRPIYQRRKVTREYAVNKLLVMYVRESEHLTATEWEK